MTRIPYGNWPGRLSAGDVAAGGLRFGGLALMGGDLIWSEGRPAEGGRLAIVRADADGGLADILPDPYSARSRVNEYGGGALWPDGDGLAFVNDADQDVYRLAADGTVTRLTNKPGWRFADGTTVGALRIAVAEIERDGGHPKTVLCAIGETDVEIVAEGRDFYAAPRLSPDGSQLVFLTWDLPWMPWQTAELWLAPVVDGGIGPARLIGGGMNRAAFQPAWSADGVLHCVLENGGGSHLCKWTPTGWEPALETDGEAGRPQWTFDIRSYALLPDGSPIVVTIDDGAIAIKADTAGGKGLVLDAGISDFGAPVALPNGRVAGFTARPGEPEAVEIIDPAKPSVRTCLKASGDIVLNDADISVGELKRFETEAGVVHALYYPPKRAGCAAPEGERPPMLVSAHGGPTSYAGRGFSPKVQYWTQRGFAVLDVDYRGSFGYGPAYRRALDGQMGLVDIGDTVLAARAAAEVGLADPDRLLISGGSAGGYVVLGALAFRDVFRAGCSKYGIGDLKVLAETTHKFEAGYLDTLLGLTGDAAHDDALMAARSPLHAVDRIAAPVLLLQGLEDRVVPPEQSRDMYEALKAAGHPVALIEFEGEGHGFRRAETVIAALELEYVFYSRILGLDPADSLPDIDIANWP
ncbi:MAG: S9 family peptidase [Rhodobiaceae bacterium]|nr:S9 family peptidase [Rhodobiaceae bacterium]